MADLYHVILGCDETTTLTSLSWCNSRGVNSTHHCHCTMASDDSQFYDLSDEDIDSLIHDEIPKNTKEATAEYLFWQVRLRILNFSFKLVKVFLLVVNSFASFVQFILYVFNLNNKNVNTLIARRLLGFTCTRSLTCTMNSKFSTQHSTKPRAVLRFLVHC